MTKLIEIEGDIEITHELFTHIIREITPIRDVTAELSEITTQFSYYHGIMIKSKRILDDTIDILEHYKSSVRTEKRKEGKLTSVAGDDFVNSLDDTVALNKEGQDRQEIYGYAKGICSSLEMKKDMLVQLSANSRMETKLYQ